MAQSIYIQLEGYCTDMDAYCHTLGYLQALASSRPTISQLGLIFTDISAITLLVQAVLSEFRLPHWKKFLDIVVR